MTNERRLNLVIVITQLNFVCMHGCCCHSYRRYLNQDMKCPASLFMRSVTDTMCGNQRLCVVLYFWTDLVADIYGAIAVQIL